MKVYCDLRVHSGCLSFPCTCRALTVWLGGRRTFAFSCFKRPLALNGARGHRSEPCCRDPQGNKFSGLCRGDPCFLIITCTVGSLSFRKSSGLHAARLPQSWQGAVGARGRRRWRGSGLRLVPKKTVAIRLSHNPGRVFFFLLFLFFLSRATRKR